MSHLNRFTFACMILSLAALACAVPAVTPTLDPDAVKTFIVQTMTAAAAKTELAVIPATATPQTPTLTFTPPPPTDTATLTLTLPPLFTPTPVVPMISVTVATNCRNGPGKVYGIEGALLVGETAEVLARDPTGNYWYIRNPDSGDEFCWVWGQYATLIGNTTALPVFTPLPTPTPTFTPTPSPNFEATFSDMDDCSNSSWWVDINLKNTGSLTFRSMGLTIIDRDTDTEMTNYTNGFVDRDGCGSTSTKDVLEPGSSFVVSSSSFAYNFDDHRIRVRITLCSNTGQSGTCVTKVINFKP